MGSPYSAVWTTWDRDSDIVYIYDSYSLRQETVPVHASAIKSRNNWIPVIWPMDGRQADKGSGKSLTTQYREEGVNLLKNILLIHLQQGMKEGIRR